MKDDEKLRLLSAAAMGACNEFIDTMFRGKNYEDYDASNKLRIIRVLKRNSKIHAKYQA